MKELGGTLRGRAVSLENDELQHDEKESIATRSFVLHTVWLHIFYGRY
jgi:hypothetical protein